MVAQGPDLPIHLGSMPLAVKAVIQAGLAFEHGDVFIHNDPYFGGSHLPDVNVVTPAFHGDTLLGFACVRAHWPDIGSATPGQLRRHHRDLRRGPAPAPRAVVRGGCPELPTWSASSSPTSAPPTSGAETSAPRWRPTSAASGGSQELARSTASARLLAIMQEVMDYSERLMRGMLAELPDGTATFEDFCDGDGIIEEGDKEDRTFRIRLRVTKQG